MDFIGIVAETDGLEMIATDTTQVSMPAHFY